MKIAIVTFHKTINYGAVFQAYALQTKISQLGHEPFFLDNDMATSNKSIGSWIGRSFDKTIEKLIFQLRSYRFHKFRKKHLNLGDNLYVGFAEFSLNPPSADVYICGSDQVWNPNYVNINKERLFWLDFGPDSIKRIGYAPSFGVSELPPNVKARYSKYAKRFSAIGVRERDAVQLVESLGFNNPTWLIDPTLLLDADDYIPIEAPLRKPADSYFFSYHVGTDKETNELMDQIMRYLTEKTSIPFHYNSIGIKAKKSYTYDPGVWLFKMRYSTFVVADSFHALMFSIIYRKPFIVVACRRTKSRLTSILSYLGLEERAVDKFNIEHIGYLYNKEVDWEGVQEKINELRSHANKFLEDNLVTEE